ncbi:MAG: hypothetical protein ABI197_10975 [Granulicella sp.]
MTEWLYDVTREAATQCVRRGGDERGMTSFVLSLIEGIAHL